MMDGQGMTDGGSGSPDAMGGSDLDSLLGTSPSGDPTGGLDGGTSGQGDGLGGTEPSAYKFAGRTWKGGQKEAEAAWNKIYGGYSDRQGLVNALKNASPEIQAALLNDPKMGPILSKLGIEAASESFNRQDSRQSGESIESLREEFAVERHQNALLHEEWAFERKLGRPMSPQEQSATLNVLSRAESLTYEEAYYLAHRSQIMKQQAQGAAANGQQIPSQGGRPKPPPRSMPGTPGQSKKALSKMSEEEWKRNLKESGVIKELLSKGIRE